jgi:hypothetical protein
MQQLLPIDPSGDVVGSNDASVIAACEVVAEAGKQGLKRSDMCAEVNILLECILDTAQHLMWSSRLNSLISRCHWSLFASCVELLRKVSKLLRAEE